MISSTLAIVSVVSSDKSYGRELKTPSVLKNIRPYELEIRVGEDTDYVIRFRAKKHQNNRKIIKQNAS